MFCRERHRCVHSACALSQWEAESKLYTSIWRPAKLWQAWHEDPDQIKVGSSWLDLERYQNKKSWCGFVVLLFIEESDIVVIYFEHARNICLSVLKPHVQTTKPVKWKLDHIFWLVNGENNGRPMQDCDFHCTVSFFATWSTTVAKAKWSSTQDCIFSQEYFHSFLSTTMTFLGSRPSFFSLVLFADSHYWHIHLISSHLLYPLYRSIPALFILNAIHNLSTSCNDTWERNLDRGVTRQWHCTSLRHINTRYEKTEPKHHAADSTAHLHGNTKLLVSATQSNNRKARARYL